MTGTLQKSFNYFYMVTTKGKTMSMIKNRQQHCLKMMNEAESPSMPDTCGHCFTMYKGEWIECKVDNHRSFIFIEDIV